jgi:hypothetical protein
MTAAERYAMAASIYLDAATRGEAPTATVAVVSAATWTAEQLVAVLRGVVTELGHDAADPAVAGVVRRHLALVAGEAA